MVVLQRNTLTLLMQKMSAVVVRHVPVLLIVVLLCKKGVQCELPVMSKV